ncbi:putative dna repair protein [Neofusicoccum parvum UCRNP2]|uniref:Putative dna repair protein n=1 Tax=Botryosphaeria parva (strain UCR-NP2) TaxID=1287680 RepID=R1GKX6_BOTPV|nr:putative dna repair protein [Neofusicoccum parvum UCRNP2]
MPNFVVPKRSGAHRVAAIALYRALLTQCAAPPLPLADDQRAALRNIVRNKFRRNRHVHSARLLKLSFTAGYELLDTLDRASSSPAAPSSLLTTLLTTAPPHLTQPPQGRKLPPPRLTPSPEACPPAERKVLAVRPRPAAALGGSGVRRVPRIVSANLFPMLRLAKPQPRSLSRVITDKVKQRQRRLNLRGEAADGWAWVAAQEDGWDGVLAEVCGVREDAEGEGGRWVDEPLHLVRAISGQLAMQKVGLEELVGKMQGIVDKEEELARVEGMQRRRERRERMMDKRREEDVRKLLGRSADSRKGGKPI